MENLTAEQEALIPAYREKWRALALSTEPVNRQQASEAVKFAYSASGLKEPQILFFDSPYAALNTVVPLLGTLLNSQLNTQLRRNLEGELSSERWDVWEQLSHRLWQQLGGEFNSHLSAELNCRLKKQLSDVLIECVQPEVWACDGSWLDFSVSVLNGALNERKWQAYQALVQSCGWIFPYEMICLVCNRPRQIRFDSQQRLHAEGEPAIEFDDGFCIWAYHGVRLPEKYGKLHPHQWQAQWLLKEKNAELRRVLIQGIGYGRILQDLRATELDSWQEYALLKLKNRIDVEPIYLLKMVCPSTGGTHATRVPPDVQSAREAIRWVNWGVDPEEFSAQT
ncbi:DUF6745 domain-containing protein [Kamptonema formosum]|uniref:DUF6745 domain-containing protein n=1 Tax=Kamptonema formosum TaxID=331992 RepID=UPI00034B736C|nr:hypothetical protein [Oscillatoria sp. PCC 10802]